MQSYEYPRILLAKPGLDGHDRGVIFLERVLRENGFHVDYTGIRKSPEIIAKHAEEVQADVVGISILSGAHMELVPSVMKELELLGLGGIPVVVGGIIPELDRIALFELGVVAIFGPGSETKDIVHKLLEINTQYKRKR